MNQGDSPQDIKKQLEEAAQIEELVNHPGWKILGQIIESFLQREIQALTGQPLDNHYYKKIGFLQMYKFCKEIPGVVKDPEIRDYLLHQGRAIGARTFQNPAKFFFEGIMKNSKIIQDYLRGNQTQLVAEKQREFHESNLQ